LACGIEQASKVIVGMFTIILWDNHEQALTLARDQMGEKPLYWGWCNDVLLFGSELKAPPVFNAEIDSNSLSLLLRHCYIPAPYTIYQGTQKLMPGHFEQVPLQGDVARVQRCAA
jgi:asparagine synthase (glutamine-hydrolysing)